MMCKMDRYYTPEQQLWIRVIEQAYTDLSSDQYGIDAKIFLSSDVAKEIRSLLKLETTSNIYLR